MFRKTLLPVWSVYSFGCVLPIVEALVGLLRAVQFPDQTRFDFGLRPHACFDVWVYFATRLADGRNQLMYSLVYSLLLAGTPVNYYSIDSRLGLPL